uniref:Cytochrome b6-f complex subunit PetP n=1 Tax=Cryptopleura ramosa TaxID=131094 RepID=A0A4D6WRB5_9FLOR|nr:cytochrome b6-f complex subunit PetP [Cryptopleura ramosa]
MKTKIKIIHYVNQKSYIVGYKQIHTNYKAPIIEFKDYTRVWMLNNEITINPK